jgi:methylenetetrahydrofolate--tRNA-(uracil-5-)-methyltransferase
VGILAAVNLDRIARGEEPVVPPPTTMLGALMRYLREADPAHFQPMNSNFGLVDPLETPVRDKQRKRELLSERGQADFAAWMARYGVEGIVPVGAAG